MKVKNALKYVCVDAEVLPLVEFTLENDIDDEDASRLIGSRVKMSNKTNEWQDANTQTLRINDDEDEEDPFTAKLLSFEVTYNPA